MDQLLTPQSGHNQTPKFFRVLNEAEKTVITPDAFGYIIKMMELGILSFEESESLIERAMTSGFLPVNLEDVEYWANGIILENQFIQTPHIKVINSSDIVH